MAKREQDLPEIKPGRTDYLTWQREWSDFVCNSVDIDEAGPTPHTVSIFRHTVKEYELDGRPVTVSVRSGAASMSLYWTAGEARRIARALMRAADDADAAAAVQQAA